jgi:fatty acid desaturase
MVKLIKFLALVSQAIFLQFLHVVGLLAFLAAAALGWYRKPSWLVPLLAVALGVAADKFFPESDVSSLLEKAQKAEERGGFMIVVYFVICAVGYVAGAYGRVHFFDGAQALPVAKPAPRQQKKK